VNKTTYDFVTVIKSINWIDNYRIKVGDNEYNLRSDLSYDLGLGVGYKGLFVGYSINTKKIFGNTDSKNSELNINLVNNIFSAEFCYLTNIGHSNIINFKNDSIDLEINHPFSGINTKIINLDFYYFFNHKKYSNSAAYSGGHVYSQKKRAGSLIAGISLTRNDFTFDFSQLLDDEQYAGLSIDDVQHVVYDSYCIGLGYGYNYVFKKNWLVNLTFVSSVGVKTVTSDENQNNYFTMRNNLRFAIIKNAPNYFYGLNCLYNSNGFFASDNAVLSSIGNYVLMFGYRF